MNYERQVETPKSSLQPTMHIETMLVAKYHLNFFAFPNRLSPFIHQNSIWMEYIC